LKLLFLLLFQRLPESTEILATTVMSTRPMSTASTTSNQNSSNSNKNQQVKSNKLGGKTNSDAGSTNDMTEISALKLISLLIYSYI
jgi:hypothetical protein